MSDRPTEDRETFCSHTAAPWDGHHEASCYIRPPSTTPLTGSEPPKGVIERAKWAAAGHGTEIAPGIFADDATLAALAESDFDRKVDQRLERTDAISEDDIAAMHDAIKAVGGAREHLIACPQCGISLEVPCAGEVVADVKIADIAWEQGHERH